jgi:ankyrin repeat protein
MKFNSLVILALLCFLQPAFSQKVIESVKNRNLQQLDFLIKSGADVNEKDNNTMTPLLWAVRNDDSASVDLLLQNGADPNALTNAGKNTDTAFTPLTLACLNGNVHIAKALLKKGANVNDKVKAFTIWDECADRTALMLAAQNGLVDIIKMLLDNNADVNQHGKFYHMISYHNSGIGIAQERFWTGDAETAIMLAVENNHSDVVELLLGRGAEVNYQDEMILPDRFTQYSSEVSNKSMKKHETALLIAASIGDTSIVRMLLDAGAKTDVENALKMSPLLNAASNGCSGALEELLARGCDINKKGGLWDGNALTWAAFGGDTAAVNVLLNHGLDINSCTDNNSSALMIAADQGRTPALKLLLDWKASIEWMNKDDQTALFRACINGHTPCVEALLAAGAKTDAKDKFDKTPLMYATERNSGTIIELLTKASIGK